MRLHSGSLALDTGCTSGEADAMAGPWVAAAFVCERVIVDQDNVPTYMRVIDVVRPLIEMTGSGVAPDGEETPLKVRLLQPLFLVVGLRADEIEGEHSRSPSVR